MLAANGIMVHALSLELNPIMVSKDRADYRETLFMGHTTAIAMGPWVKSEILETNEEKPKFTPQCQSWN